MRVGGTRELCRSRHWSDRQRQQLGGLVRVGGTRELCRSRGRRFDRHRQHHSHASASGVAWHRDRQHGPSGGGEAGVGSPCHGAENRKGEVGKRQI